MAPTVPSRRFRTWLARHKTALGACLCLWAGALLAQPALLRQASPDGSLHPDTLLSITFLRLFLAVLGLAALVWTDLADPRRRGLLIGLVMLATLAGRSVRLNTPYLDQHAHRQTDVATIARNFYELYPNILWPQVNWRADAPNYVETTFPLVPWLTALGYRLVGEQPWVGRGLVVAFSVLGAVAMFGLVALYWGQAAGFFAALFLALSPLAIYFGRALIDDMAALALATAGLWGLAVWAHTGSRRALVLGMAAVALALLVKIVAVFIYFPLLAVLWERWRWQSLRRPLAWAILLLPLLPALAWYSWARELGRHYLTFGLGGKASTEPDTYGAASKWGSPDFVLRQAFVAKIGRRVWQEVMTLPGALAVAAGAAVYLRRGRPGRLVFGSLALGVLVVVAVTGRAQWYHNYYQLPFAVALAPFAGLGLAWLWRQAVAVRHAGAPAAWSLGRWLALALVLLLAAFSATKLPYYYNDWQGWILPEAALVHQVTTQDDRIVTVTMEGDTALLYHLHRPGWVVDFTNEAALADVPKHLAQGARLVILQDLTYPQTAGLFDQPWLQGLEPISRTAQYAIYQAP
jgi:4-amino-4-deoxy-L-arabinose transferase-like glycosyltransferase